MTTLAVRAADELRPGGAPVSAHSEFAPVLRAVPLPFAVQPHVEHATGSGRISVALGGRWEQWADLDGDPGFPEHGARRSAGVPGNVEWRRITVPENFGYDEELSRHFAPVWYRRTFADPRHEALPESPQQVRLRFAAVDYLADVWLNDEHLGHHEGAFAPFGFDVSDRLTRNNQLVVAVQDPLEPLDPSELFFRHRKRVIKGALKYHDSRPGGMPGRMAGPLASGDDPWVWTPEWGQSMSTGGIVGPVTLERTGDVSIAGLFVTPVGTGVQVAVVLTNRSAATDVRVELELGDEHAVLAVTAPPGAGRVDVLVDRHELARWASVDSPEGTPAVHRLSVTLATLDGTALDRRSTTFGLRSAVLARDDTGRARHLEVDGRPTFVKAVDYIPWQHFAEVGADLYERDLRMLVDAHGNSIGIHAHVQSPLCYEAADRAGVLVFQGFPMQWSYDSGTRTNPGFVDEACRQVADMAYLLYNHPSVVYYVCHDEPRRMFDPSVAGDGPEADLGEAHLDAALERALRTVDGSRHVQRASGIGDDVHSYLGSRNGGDLYRVREQPSWFVSEYGFPTIGPQAAKFGDPPTWPPDGTRMREWASRLSSIGSTCGFAGLPERYGSLAEWVAATQSYGAALAKHQTEWFRAHRGAPYMGYRWHFWSDWWGYAGAGLVDVERVPKATYTAFKDAGRPLLVVGLQDASVVERPTVTVPVVVVNDRSEVWSGRVAWEVVGATSSVFAPDLEGARIGLTVPPDAAARVAVPRDSGPRLAEGTIDVEAGPTAVTPAGEIAVELPAGTARTVWFRWDDPVEGPQSNSVHFHHPAPGEHHAPGLTAVP
jgi:beta-mannosidase